MEAILITVLFIIMVEVDAIGDGFKYNHTRSLIGDYSTSKWKKWFGWQSENILLFLGLVVYPVLLVHYEATIVKILIYSLAGYPLIRLSLFNITWNKITKKKDWWFYGTQKGTDKILRWFIEKSLFARWFKPNEGMAIAVISLFSFLFSLVATGIWQFIEK